MATIKSIAVPVPHKRSSYKSGSPGEPALPAKAHDDPAGQYRRPARAVAAPPRHRYRIGEHLLLLGGGNSWSRAEGSCRVTALMPHESGPLLYRVKSDVEGFERVVAEADLSRPGREPA